MPDMHSSDQSRCAEPARARRSRCGSTTSGSGHGAITDAGGWHTPLNERLGVDEGETVALHWTLDHDAGVGVDQRGRRGRAASRSSA